MADPKVKTHCETCQRANGEVTLKLTLEKDFEVGRNLSLAAELAVLKPWLLLLDSHLVTRCDEDNDFYWTGVPVILDSPRFGRHLMNHVLYSVKSL